MLTQYNEWNYDMLGGILLVLRPMIKHFLTFSDYQSDNAPANLSSKSWLAEFQVMADYQSDNAPAYLSSKSSEIKDRMLVLIG